MRRSNPLLLAGAGIVAVLALAAVLAPWAAPFPPNAQDILSRLQGPGRVHWLGTDNLGRDTLSRLMWGYRTLFAISAGSIGTALLVGGAAGTVGALEGGWFDRVAMRVMDVLFAFPVILLAIGVIAVLGPGAWSTAAAIALVYLPVFARTLRAPALLLRDAEFVHAARIAGAGRLRVAWRHVAPNLAAAALVQASLSLSTAVLVEASLSFLSLGTQPPTPSLGRMLAESRVFLALSPFVSVFSGVAILLASLGFNLLGDGLQDRLDPRKT